MTEPENELTTVDDVQRHKTTPNRDLYFMTAVMATGFSTIAAVLATMFSENSLLILMGFLPAMVFFFASRDYYGAAFPSLNSICSSRGGENAE